LPPLHGIAWSEPPTFSISIGAILKRIKLFYWRRRSCLADFLKYKPRKIREFLRKPRKKGIQKIKQVNPCGQSYQRKKKKSEALRQTFSNFNFWREASLCAFSFASLCHFKQNRRGKLIGSLTRTG
jgi:hypothetical protein